MKRPFINIEILSGQKLTKTQRTTDNYCPGPMLEMLNGDSHWQGDALWPVLKDPYLFPFKLSCCKIKGRFQPFLAQCRIPPKDFLFCQPRSDALQNQCHRYSGSLDNGLPVEYFRITHNEIFVHLHSPYFALGNDT